MRHFKSAVLLIAAVFLAVFAVSAQETELTVVDEVVAQVNDDVITLSDIKREIKNQVDALVQEGSSRADAEKLIEEKKAELVANLINERLILQKAEDSVSDATIEAEINRRFVEIMQQQGIKTTEELYQAMRAQGLEPDEIRAVYRKGIMREFVEGEIFRKIYWEPNAKKVKEYYEANKEKFIKPETVTVSEIFLSFAAKDQETVRRQARDILAELRKGGSFEDAVLTYSERPNKEETKGKAGTFEVAKLDPKVIEALKGVNAGTYAEPIELDEGIVIIRIDERTKGGAEASFVEADVRRAIASDRFADARKKYMTDLRGEAYIKINESWRPMISPILFADDRKTQTTSKSN